MTHELSRLRADPAVVEAWITGWTLSRETAPPVPVAGGFGVEVGLPEHRRRYVLPAASKALSRLAESIDEAWVFLKVCATTEAAQALCPARWTAQPLGFMMEVDGSAKGAGGAFADGYALGVRRVGSVLVAEVTGPDDSLAAKGRAALTDGFAVYDQIVTDVNHQRRGLGRQVMAALTAAAVDHGVRRGVLVATPEGRALYQTLGWRMHTPMSTFVIPAEPSPAP